MDLPTCTAESIPSLCTKHRDFGQMLHGTRHTSHQLAGCKLGYRKKQELKGRGVPGADLSSQLAAHPSCTPSERSCASSAVMAKTRCVKPCAHVHVSAVSKAAVVCTCTRLNNSAEAVSCCEGAVCSAVVAYGKRRQALVAAMHSRN